MKTKTLHRALFAASVSAVLLIALFFSAPVTTWAQDEPTPEQRAAAAVELRQGLFQLIYFNMRPLGGMAQGAVPYDAELAERNARRIAAIAPMIPDVFANDTRNFDVETQALERIWDNTDDFADKAQTLADNATAFADAVAAGGDMAANSGAFRALGGSCGNCHDDYRVDED